MMEAQNNEQEQQLETAAVLWSGHLLYDDQVVPCLIISISAAGAVVETTSAAVWNSSVILRHPRIGDLKAVVVSRKNDELNLRFPQKTKEDQEKVSALIEKALRLIRPSVRTGLGKPARATPWDAARERACPMTAGKGAPTP